MHKVMENLEKFVTELAHTETPPQLEIISISPPDADYSGWPVSQQPSQYATTGQTRSAKVFPFTDKN